MPLRTCLVIKQNGSVDRRSRCPREMVVQDISMQGSRNGPDTRKTRETAIGAPFLRIQLHTRLGSLFL